MDAKDYIINWDKAFLVDIPLIDSQHRRLLKRIELLLNGILKGKGEAEIGSMLKFLEFYVEGHFNSEEKYMRECNYPETESHKKQHRHFEEMIEDFRNLFYIEGPSKAWLGSWSEICFPGMKIISWPWIKNLENSCRTMNLTKKNRK